MEFRINPQKLCSVFTLPCEVVDKHIKMAGTVQLKVLLWAFRHMSEGISPEKISATLGVSQPDVIDSLRFWADLGVFSAEDDNIVAPAESPTVKVAVRAEAIKPDRNEIAKRGLECPEIAFILREAQLKFGRALRQNEASTLVWLFDDEGMSAALILMLIEYAVSSNKCNIGFIERTAVDWINSGIDNIAAAEKRIITLKSQHGAWRIVESTMGLEHRSPSAKELQNAYTWVTEWGYGRDILRQAYEQCVDTTSKFSFPYIKKILENWHAQKVKTVDDIVKLQKPETVKKESFAAYDSGLVEKMLNEDYE